MKELTSEIKKDAVITVLNTQEKSEKPIKDSVKRYCMFMSVLRKEL